MKKYALALSALMILSGVAMAADAPAATTTTKTTTTKTKTVKVAKTTTPAAKKAMGAVISVDAVANTLTIKSHKDTATYAISATAKITSGKKEVKLADITAGEHVSVTYTKDGATMTASSVKVMPAMAKAKKAAAPAASK